MRTHETSNFQLKKILDMGARVEAALFNNNISQEDKKILEYLKEYLDLRKKILDGEITSSTKTLDDKMIDLKISEEDIHALGLWARGSRKRKNDIFDRKELDSLYERIEKKLSNL